MEIILNKIKVFWDKYKKEAVFGGLIFLTATTSFALGYLFARDKNHAPIIIEKVDLPS